MSPPVAGGVDGRCATGVGYGGIAVLHDTACGDRAAAVLLIERVAIDGVVAQQATIGDGDKTVWAKTANAAAVEACCVGCHHGGVEDDPPASDIRLVVDAAAVAARRPILCNCAAVDIDPAVVVPNAAAGAGRGVLRDERAVGDGERSVGAVVVEAARNQPAAVRDDVAGVDSDLSTAEVVERSTEKLGDVSLNSAPVGHCDDAAV